MNKHRTISVTEEFHPKPFGRYPSQSDFCGQNFREKILADALKENDKVIVVLTGYNRYGRSFIDESFGGLVRCNDQTEQYLKEHLEIIHDELPSLIELAWTRIHVAQNSKKDA